MFQILIVDDDKNVRRYLGAVLAEAGYSPHTASSAKETMEKLETISIDLMILDIMMPGMDGYEFTETLRGVQNQLPILMVSARQLPEDRKKGFRAGIDDYMTKPVDMEELVLRIQALLRRSRIASEHRITLGQVTLDYDSLTVTGHGQTLELPQKEFQLLYKLLSSPGKIFTRIQLMDEIWGMDSESGWETVTVHIGRLRKRFEGWPEFEIVSVRGLGYKAVKHL